MPISCTRSLLLLGTFVGAVACGGTDGPAAPVASPTTTDTTSTTSPSSSSTTSTGTSGTTSQATTGATRATFYVEGRNLFDRCGEKVVLRGVNEMVVWSGSKDGDPEFAEIAKTGANVVRIVWTSDGTAAELDVAISNAVAQKLIPMVEHHGATGVLSKVPAVVDYWTQADVVAVLKKHEANLLLNVANEAGDKESNEEFETVNRTAITRLREAGLNMPLIIDATGWGQKIDVLQERGPALIEHDPLHNVMLSVHMWWSDPDGARVRAELAQSVEMGLPLIVGEFAQHAVYLCDKAPFAYGVLLDEAARLEVGWLAWSWGGVANNDCKAAGPFDMATGGVFGSWTGTWAEEVAVSHANSIKNTSVRPASMVNGVCQ